MDGSIFYYQMCRNVVMSNDTLQAQIMAARHLSGNSSGLSANNGKEKILN